MKSLIAAAYGPFVAGRNGLGLLLLRLIVGGAFVVHGLPKIQAPFNWMGPTAPVPGFLQALAAVAEFFGGLALIVGALTPLASLGLAFTMAFALFMVHIRMGHAWIASDPSKASYEIVALYLISFITLILTGPGAYSIDAHLLDRKRTSVSQSVAQSTAQPATQ